jgi:hypothetical protein
MPSSGSLAYAFLKIAFKNTFTSIILTQAPQIEPQSPGLFRDPIFGMDGCIDDRIGCFVSTAVKG